MNMVEPRVQLLTLLKPFTRRLPPEFVVTDSHLLSSDLNIDSADLVDLVLKMEECFDIQIPDSAIGELKSVGQVVSLLEEQRRAA